MTRSKVSNSCAGPRCLLSSSVLVFFLSACYHLIYYIIHTFLYLFSCPPPNISSWGQGFFISFALFFPPASASIDVCSLNGPYHKGRGEGCCHDQTRLHCKLPGRQRVTKTSSSNNRKSEAPRKDRISKDPPFARGLLGWVRELFLRTGPWGLCLDGCRRRSQDQPPASWFRPSV